MTDLLWEENGFLRVVHVPSIPYPPELADAFQEFYEAEDQRTWRPYVDVPIDNHDGTYRYGDRMPRPKDQDQDEPATPPATQTRSLSWTGYQLTIKELRSWLDQIPNHAVLHGWSTPNHAPLEGEIRATWEIP